MIEGQWVVPDMVTRYRQLYGLYGWHEYERFAGDWEIAIRLHHRSDVPSAFHVGRTIVLRHSPIRIITAKRAWHEIGHIIAFPFNCLYWDDVPWGDLVERKVERRTADFAETFPVWDSSVPIGGR